MGRGSSGRSLHQTFARAALTLVVVLLTSAAIADTVAWYRFEEGTLGSVASGVGSVPDSSGNTLHGTPTGTDGPAYVGGLAPFGSLALSFDGTDDQVFVPDHPKLKVTQSLTLEAFVNVASFGKTYLGNVILLRGDDRDGLDSYILHMKPDTEELRFWVEGGGTGGAADLRTPFTWLGKTIHVAGVLDDATGFMGLYVNGQLQNSLTTGVRARGDLDPAHNPGMGIGNHTVPSGGFPLDGTIDEVRVSDEALSPRQFLCAVPPVLSWVGSPRYQGDGVYPNRGFRGDRFSFRVTYTDWNGDPPRYLRMHLRRDGKAYGTFVLRSAFGSLQEGQVFRFERRLPVGSYGYRFVAADPDGPATGDPTGWTAGPQVDAPPQPRPDALVKAGTQWLGENLYNTTGAGQGHARDVRPGGRTFYRVRVQNDRAELDTLRVTGSAGAGPWRTAYFDSTGANVTADVTGVGWTTPVLAAGGSVELSVRVTASAGATVGAKAAAFVRAGRALWVPDKFALRADTVRLVTTVVSDDTAPACQVAGLAAVPTVRGAQIVFSLSAPAQVDAQVLNVAGRPVATVCHARECHAGTTTLVWNAMGDQGLPVPNGMYLMEVSAKTQDGSRSRGLAQVRIRR